MYICTCKSIYIYIYMYISQTDRQTHLLVRSRLGQFRQLFRDLSLPLVRHGKALTYIHRISGPATHRADRQSVRQADRQTQAHTHARQSTRTRRTHTHMGDRHTHIHTDRQHTHTGPRRKTPGRQVHSSSAGQTERRLTQTQTHTYAPTHTHTRAHTQTQATRAAHLRLDCPPSPYCARKIERER